MEVVLQDYRQQVLENATVTASGSAVFDGFGAKELNLIINVSAAPTGTTPSITFQVQEVDPGDGATVLGNSATGTAITAQGTQIVNLPMTYGGTVKVSWTVTGATPSFTGVYVSLISKVAGSTALFNESGTSAMGTAGTPGAAVVSIQGVVGGTAVPVSFVATGDNHQTGTITSNQNVAVASQGDGNCSVVIGATAWTGTIVFEGLAGDGTTWVPVTGYNTANGEPTQSVTANGEWTIPCAGYQQIRVRGNTVATGTATIALDASMGAPGAIQVATGGQAAGGATAVGYPSLVSPLTDNGLVGEMAFGESWRLRVGQEALLFLDTFDGTTLNTVRWASSTLTMTQAQTQGKLDMNSGGDHTASTYSILTSNKHYAVTGEFALECRFRAKLTPQTNATLELGFFNAATTAAPTNGVFFRITSAGVQELVINYNGTETVSAAITPALTAADYYMFVLYLYGNTARLDILNWDNSLFATTTLQAPATQGGLVQVGWLPVAARLYNGTTPPAAAADIALAAVDVVQLDQAKNESWEMQLGSLARFANSDPLTGAQLQNYANNTAPSTIASGSLSNTAAAYSTLGGLFAFNPPASSENDLILFAYQVPANYNLLIWSISISMALIGSQSSTTPQVYQWGLAVGSSAVSLATAGSNPPLRFALGLTTSPKSASLGDPVTPALLWTPRTPQVCYGGKYVHVFFRPVSSNATANQICRGSVSIDGVFA
jgi:hypothetical protein